MGKYILLLIMVCLAFPANTLYQYVKEKSDIEVSYEDKVMEYKIEKKEKEVIKLEPIIVTAKNEDIKDKKEEIKENVEQPKLTLSEDIIKKEILNSELGLEQKRRMLEELTIDLQSKLDSKNLFENKESMFAPGFLYTTYEYRKSTDKDFSFDFLINLKPFNFDKNIDDEYIKLIQKYIDAKTELETKELQDLKIIFGLFACSDANGYSIFKEMNESYNIKTLYVFENSKKEKDYVYYTSEECDNINKQLKK